MVTTPRYSGRVRRAKCDQQKLEEDTIIMEKRRSDNCRYSGVHHTPKQCEIIKIRWDIPGNDFMVAISKSACAGGSYSDIYIGRARRQVVAVKKVRQHAFSSENEYKRNCFREADVWKSLKHPNIVPFYGASIIGSMFYFISPWQSQGQIMQYLSANSHVDRMKILYQISGALAYLHSHTPKIIHGDISSQPNILVSAGGQPLLCDFGSSFRSPVTYDSASTCMYESGSLRYMAPELIKGMFAKSEASDTFAFAILSFEILSGDTPYVHLKSDVFVVFEILKGGRPHWTADMRAMYSEIESLIVDCWAELPSDRPTMMKVRQRIKDSMCSKVTFDLR